MPEIKKPFQLGNAGNKQDKDLKKSAISTQRMGSATIPPKVNSSLNRSMLVGSQPKKPMVGVNTHTTSSLLTKKTAPAGLTGTTARNVGTTAFGKPSIGVNKLGTTYSKATATKPQSSLFNQKPTAFTGTKTGISVASSFSKPAVSANKPLSSITKPATSLTKGSVATNTSLSVAKPTLFTKTAVTKPTATLSVKPLATKPTATPLSNSTGMKSTVTKPVTDKATKPLSSTKATTDDLISRMNSIVKKDSHISTTETKEENEKWHVGNKVDMIIIGASAGGADALIEVLPLLPTYLPPVLVVQHMEARFTALYANRLKSICKMKVHELKDGEMAEPGNIYIAPGGYHTTLCEINGHCYFKLDISAKVSGHRPSVNVIFDSAARTLGNRAIGVILTGMGDDGAQGLLKLRNTGAYTIGQDKATCLVYGMPKVAKDIGAVFKQLPLDKIAMDIVFRCGIKPGK